MLWNRQLVGCVALVVMLVCAGCGSGGSSSRSATVSTPITTSPTSTTDTTTPPSAPTTTAKPPSSPAPAVKAKSKVQEAKVGPMTLTSSVFTMGGKIPVRYTCDGANESPPVSWSNVPTGTAELVLLVLDPAGGAQGEVQWAVAGMPPSVDHIAGGSVPAGVVVGANSLGKDGWGGVCGRKGVTQHLLFLLYALRAKRKFSSGFKALSALGMLKSARLASGLTDATYERH